MQASPLRTTRSVLLAVMGLVLCLQASTARAFPGTGSAFESRYPQSATIAEAGCAACHALASGGSNWNAYGIALRLGGLDFVAIEDLDSDGDGFSNLFEILASSQPGWCDPTVTSGCDNREFDGSGADVGPATPPSGILLDPAAPAPEIDVVPLVVGFGSLTVGTSAVQSTTVSNLGDADLTVTALTLFGSADFTLGTGAPATPFVVTAGGSVEIPVQYLPSDVGGDAGTLEIESDDADEPTVTVSLDGSGVPPVVGCDIDVASLVLDFGEVEVGSAASLSTTVGNTGNADCIVSELSLSGSPDFSLGTGAPATPFSVAPGGAIGVPVDYAPSEVGGDSGMLSIASDDTDEPAVDVALSGSGFTIPTVGDIDVSPPLLDFGFVTVGSAANRSLTIANRGQQDLSITALALEGSPDFSLGAAAPIPPFLVPADSSVAVPLRYEPGEFGAAQGTILVESDDLETPVVSAGLAGIGVSGAGVCDIDVDPLSLDFGEVDVGATAELQTTIGNTGDGDCVLGELSLSGGPEFTFGSGTPDAVCAIPPAASVPVTLAYTPIDAGADAATLSIASNDPVEPRVEVPAAGTGRRVAAPDIEVSPLLLDFGSVTLGGAAGRTATLSNRGTSELTVTDLALRGSTDFAFGANAPATPFSIPAAGSVGVPIDYAPTDVGDDAGSLDVASDDPDEPNVTVALSGTGAEPVRACDIDVNPLVLDFGGVVVGRRATLSTTVGNSGDADCVVDELRVSGSTDFALGAGAPATPFTLAPAAAVTVPVDYSPADIGADAGTLGVGSNDPDQPDVVVSLAGVGEMEPPPPTGEELYDANCGFCHGDFDAPPPVAERKVLGARSCTIEGSIYGTSVYPGGVPEMQFLQGLLSADEIERIVAYLNSRPVTGQERYVTACAGCHGIDGSGGPVDEDVRGDEADETAEAIREESEMRFLRCLPSSDVNAIVAYLERLDDDHYRSDASGLLSVSALSTADALPGGGAGPSGLPRCIPEPTAGLLAATSLIVVSGLRRRRRR